MAALQAYAQLGPIAGTAAAVAIAATTAFQINSILEQRNAIMSTTLEGATSSGGMASSSQRVAKSTLNSHSDETVPQAQSGRYDVIGNEDGQRYRNVRYMGTASTGIVSTPTLIAEKGDELIVDNPTLRNIRMNAPYLLSQIREMRVSQRAKGNYSSIDGSTSTAISVTDNKELIDVLGAVKSLLKYLAENKIEAGILLSDFEKKRKIYNESLTRGSR